MIAPPNKDKVKKPAAKRIGLARLAVWAVVGIAVAGVAYFLIKESDVVAEKKEKVAKKGLIAEVKPEIAQSRTVEDVPVEEVKQPEHRKGEIWYSADGKKMITLEKDGILQDVEVFVPQNRPVSKTRIFAHKSENAIANLMYTVPGTPTFGRTNFTGYQEDFLQSCEEPIIIEDGDDDFTKQLKSDVREMKIVLKDRIDDGENLDEILTEAREELKKLAAVRKNIESLVRKEASTEGVTEEDLEDLRQAANMMLEAKGIPPLRANKIIDFHLRKLQELQ